MQIADDLRKEAQLCLDSARNTTDPAIKRWLAVRSFELVQQAVALNLMSVPGQALALQGASNHATD
jgi:hypothetical protein